MLEMKQISAYKFQEVITKAECNLEFPSCGKCLTFVFTSNHGEKCKYILWNRYYKTMTVNMSCHEVWPKKGEGGHQSPVF